MDKAELQKLIASTKLEVTNQEGLDKWSTNNHDPYGARIVSYAVEWGRLMQVRMSEGETLVECADAASKDCDYDGITGFMYGAAVQVLSGCWKHGEALRRWHNGETQIGDEGDKANTEGGVLNPAIMSIGSKLGIAPDGFGELRDLLKEVQATVELHDV